MQGNGPPPPSTRFCVSRASAALLKSHGTDVYDIRFGALNFVHVKNLKPSLETLATMELILLPPEEPPRGRIVGEPPTAANPKQQRFEAPPLECSVCYLNVTVPQLQDFILSAGECIKAAVGGKLVAEVGYKKAMKVFNDMKETEKEEAEIIAKLDEADKASEPEPVPAPKEASA